MAIYFMNGKTFLEQYITEEPKKVMKTQFVIVSSTIRKTGKYKEQVINASSYLLPSQELFVDYDNYKTNHKYQNGYKDEILNPAKAFLATIIKYAIEEQATIVFLCGHRERKYYYLELIQEFVEDEFGIHIYDYKKLKEGKEHVRKYYPSLVLQKCNKVLKDATKKEKQKKLSTERGRKEYFKSLSKKELKKKLKKRQLYFPVISKSEMRDTLDAFM